MKNCSIMIEREGRQILVEVCVFQTGIAYEEDGTEHSLTLLEVEEAVERLTEAFAADVEPEPVPVASRREDDAAASLWMGERFEEMDRRTL
jgi:hypothetical protein